MESLNHRPVSHAAQRPDRKRKASFQDNERLSKRLSLLNIEQSGQKLYVPVEAPSVPTPNNHTWQSSSGHTSHGWPNPTSGGSGKSDDSMQLDDSKHKVYIFNIDDELAYDSDVESDDAGKLIFLPDIQKHLRKTRIPPRVFANDQGELAGMQMVLYSDPKSLTVPEEQDSVRKAILEARRRLREKQQDQYDAARRESTGSISTSTKSAETATQDYDMMDTD